MIGDGTIALAFDASIGEVDIQGRISVVDTNEVQAASTGSSASETVVAVVEGTSRATVAGPVELPVFVTANNTTIPYGANQELVLYLDAIVYSPGLPVGPNEGVYLTGGEFVFLLMEYHDAVPVSLELPPALEQEAVRGLDSRLRKRNPKERPPREAFLCFLRS